MQLQCHREYTIRITHQQLLVLQRLLGARTRPADAQDIHTMHCAILAARLAQHRCEGQGLHAVQRALELLEERGPVPYTPQAAMPTGTGAMGEEGKEENPKCDGKDEQNAQKPSNFGSFRPNSNSQKLPHSGLAHPGHKADFSGH